MPSPVRAGRPDRFVRNTSGVAFRLARRGATVKGRYPRRLEGREGWPQEAACPGAWQSRRPSKCRALETPLASKGVIRQARARRPRMIMSRSLTLRLSGCGPGWGRLPAALQRGRNDRGHQVRNGRAATAGKHSSCGGAEPVLAKPWVVSSRVLCAAGREKSSSFRPHAQAYGLSEYSNIVTGRQFALAPRSGAGHGVSCLS